MKRAKAETEAWFVYIVQAACGKLYTGISTDVQRRFTEHAKQGGKGAKFFHLSSPDKIVFCEPHPNRSEASKRESMIKKMKRKEKLSLLDVVLKRDW